MPRRNTRERDQLGPHHVHNRASSGRAVFRSDADRDRFLAILASRLNGRHKFRDAASRRAGAELAASVASYCLMTTHFHLIVWQHEQEQLRRLIQSVLAAYVRYYNNRYGTRGALFAGPFRSRPINDEKDYRWTTAYVHANHPDGPTYKYSSHNSYADGSPAPEWLDSARALKIFGGREAYRSFMNAHAARAQLDRRFF